MNPLNRALHELAEVPGPENLADKALRGAKRRRRLTSSATALAITGLIVLPFALKPQAGASLTAAAEPSKPVASANVQSDQCPVAPSKVPNAKEVAPTDWPDYMKITFSLLPVRSDYVMQSGTAKVCSGFGAYAVINVGPGRESGHVTMRLQRADKLPHTCAEVPAFEKPTHGPDPVIVHCNENVGAIKLVYAIEIHNTFRVHAIYADGRVVTGESLPPDSAGGPVITVADLLKVVTSREMAILIP